MKKRKKKKKPKTYSEVYVERLRRSIEIRNDKIVQYYDNFSLLRGAVEGMDGQLHNMQRLIQSQPLGSEESYSPRIIDADRLRERVPELIDVYRDVK